LILVDQHAAHERVIFDALRASLDSGAPLTVQQLLFPGEFELTPAEVDVLEDVRPVLEGLGYAVEPFGGRSVLVRAVPVLLAELDVRQVVAELAASAGEGVALRRSPAALLERLLQGLACRAAVKANHALTPVEAEALLEQWAVSAQPWTCPHGRPVALRWSWPEVAASFLRR
jgi:DNA mismatch repair protein MutL